MVRHSGANRDRVRLLVWCADSARGRLQAAVALWRRPMRRQADAIHAELHHAGVCVASLRVPRDGTPLRWSLEHGGARLESAAFTLLSSEGSLTLRGTLTIEARAECPAERLAAALWPPSPTDRTEWMLDCPDVLALRQVVLRCAS